MISEDFHNAIQDINDNLDGAAFNIDISLKNNFVLKDAPFTFIGDHVIRLDYSDTPPCYIPISEIMYFSLSSGEK